MRKPATFCHGFVADQNAAFTRAFDVTAITPHPSGITPPAGAWRRGGNDGINGTTRDMTRHQTVAVRGSWRIAIFPTSNQKLLRLLRQSTLGQLPVGLVCFPQNFLRLFSCQTLLSPASELAQFFVLLVRVHLEEQLPVNQKLTKAGVAQGPSGEGLLTC